MNHKKLLILGLAILLIASISLSSIPPGHSVGGLATSSFVQLDSNSQSQSDVTVTPLGTLTTGLTFRAGAVVTGAANPATGQVLSTDSHLKLNDTNNNIWDQGETVVYDTNLNNVYDPSSSNVEPIVAGITPATGSTLKTDAKIKFIDNNADGIWNAGETVVYDADNLNTFNTGDSLIAPAVFGWQFAINYDPAFLVPQADPSALCTGYPDCANAPGQPGGTVLLGSVGSVCPVYLAGGAVTGGCNWNSCASGCGSLAFTQPVPGKALVGFTYLAPKGAVFINTNVLLANVAFEIIKSGTTTISLSDLKFVDRNAAIIPGFGPGTIVTNTITINNNPPTASFTTTQVSDPLNCPSGVPGTCIRFDGSASSDPEDITIAATNFFWDFGDGTQDLGATGAVVVHDYGAIGPGTYDVLLRFVDSVLATGAARNSSGGVIRNSQPSHTDQNVNAVVTAAATTTSVSCTPSSVAVGSPTTCTATVTDTSGTPTAPTGTVSFATSGTGTFTPLTSCTLTGPTSPTTCSVTYTPSGTAPRTDSITGTYGGDSGHTGSNNNATPFSLSVTAGAHATRTAVSCAPSTIVISQGTTCTATVNDIASGASVPSGTVGFTNSGTATGSFTGAPCTLAPLNTTAATCQVTFNPTSTGTVIAQATYTPAASDTTHTTSSGTGNTVTVNKRNTTTTVTCSPSPVVVAQATTCTSFVKDTSAGTASTPAGTVAVTNTGTATAVVSGSPCTLTTVNATTASCNVTINPSTTGTIVASATYTVAASDTVHLGSSGTSVAVTVNQRTTSTSISCSPSPAVVAQSVSCTAFVKDTAAAGTASTPAGTVSFSNTGTAAGSFSGSPCTLTTVNATTASCSASFNPTGSGTLIDSSSYSVAASDTAHSASSGTSNTVTVNRRQTTTSVSCTPTTVNTGQTVTCTSFVKDIAGAGTASTPAGTVAVTNTGTSLPASFSGSPCTLTTVNATTASCQVTIVPTTQGTVIASASYTASAADTAHANSSGTSNTVSVGGRPTLTIVTCTPTTIVVAQSTSCTAFVKDNGGAGATTPGGTVAFTNTGTASGSFTGTPCNLTTVNATTSSCSASISPTTSGTVVASATYTPNDSVHNTSSGSSAAVTVNRRQTTTTVSCSPASVVVGQATSCTAFVKDTAGVGTASTPAGAVAFTQTGTAAGSFSGSPCTLTTVNATTASCSATFNPTGHGTVIVSGAYTPSAADPAHANSSGTSNTVTVSLRQTTTTASCTPTSVAVGQLVTCTAFVKDTAAGTASTPAGTVAFTQTGSSAGSFSGSPCTLTTINVTTASCQATITPTTAGTVVASVSYTVAASDTAHSASSGTSNTVRVGGTSQTTTTVTSTPAAVVVAQSISR